MTLHTLVHFISRLVEDLSYNEVILDHVLAAVVSFLGSVGARYDEVYLAIEEVTILKLNTNTYAFEKVGADYNQKAKENKRASLIPLLVSLHAV